MIRSLVLLVLTGLTINPVLSQQSCVSSQYNLRQLANDPQLAVRQKAIARFLEPSDGGIRMLGATGNPTEQTIINIPVIVHVVYNGNAQNITDAQIMSQIEILNSDFRRRNR
ncbi:MAG TPA: hypothetical protein VK625_07605, partial [Flavitalea sp.]|nr:hypothetical protein [Flavitalea sp.]